MAIFKMALPDGTPVEIEADSARAAVTKVQEFLLDGGSMFRAQGAGEDILPPLKPEPEVPVEVPADDPVEQPVRKQEESTFLGALPTQEQFSATLRAQIGGALGDAEEASLDPEAARKARMGVAALGGFAGGTGFIPSVIAGALSGAAAPADDVEEQAKQAGIGALVSGGMSAILKGAQAIWTNLLSPKAHVRAQVQNALGETGQKVEDIKTAVKEADEAGIPVSLDEVVNSTALDRLRQQLAAAPKFSERSAQFLRDRSQKIVEKVESIANRLGDPGADKSAVGKQLIQETDNALDGLRTARRRQWDADWARIEEVAGDIKVTQATNTRKALEDTLEDIAAGRVDVSPTLQGQLTRLSNSLEGGLDAKQLQANLKAFRRNAQRQNENAPVWADLKESLQSDIDGIGGTNIAADLVKRARSNYAQASTEIGDLEKSILGKAVKRLVPGASRDGKSLMDSISRLEASELKTLTPMLQKYAPNALPSIRARVVMDSLEGTLRNDGTVDIAKLAGNLPRGDRFSAMFGSGVDKATKREMLIVADTMNRLSRSSARVVPEASTAEASAIGRATGGQNVLQAGVNMAQIVRTFREPKVAAEVLLSKKGRKLVDELSRPKSRLPGDMFKLSRGSSAYLADLLVDFAEKPSPEQM